MKLSDLQLFCITDFLGSVTHALRYIFHVAALSGSVLTSALSISMLSGNTSGQAGRDVHTGCRAPLPPGDRARAIHFEVSITGVRKCTMPRHHDHAP